MRPQRNPARHHRSLLAFDARELQSSLVDLSSDLLTSPLWKRHPPKRRAGIHVLQGYSECQVSSDSTPRTQTRPKGLLRFKLELTSFPPCLPSLPGPHPSLSTSFSRLHFPLSNQTPHRQLPPTSNPKTTLCRRASSHANLPISLSSSLRSSPPRLLLQPSRLLLLQPPPQPNHHHTLLLPK